MDERSRDDKNHLAMLAVPVILSLLLGFSGDVRAMERMESEAVAIERVEGESREVGATEEVVDDRGRSVVKAVVEGDYERFLQTIKGTPFAEVMTKEAFVELKEQYQHINDGFVISPFKDRGGPIG